VLTANAFYMPHRRMTQHRPRHNSGGPSGHPESDHTVARWISAFTRYSPDRDGTYAARTCSKIVGFAALETCDQGQQRNAGQS